VTDAAGDAARGVWEAPREFEACWEAAWDPPSRIEVMAEPGWAVMEDDAGAAEGGAW